MADALSQNAFQEAFERLESIDEETFFDRVYGFFHTINLMGTPEVIAAFQAIRLYAKIKQIPPRSEPYRSIKGSLIARMAAIYFQANEEEKPGLEDTFSAVTDMLEFSLYKMKGRNL